MEIATRQRKFLPDTIRVSGWEIIEPYYVRLLQQDILSVEELKQWLRDRNELEEFLQEDLAWRYIRMNIDTTHKGHQQAYYFFVENISPRMATYEHQLNQKLYQSPYLKALSSAEPQYRIYERELVKDIEIFREENIPLQTELSKESQRYGEITGAMTIEHEGLEITLQQAARYLKSTDRNLRQQIYEKIHARRMQDKDMLEELFDKLIALRHKVALNAGFSNYRDYMFKAMGRFDYTPRDCFLFHEAIEKCVKPIVEQWDKEKKDKLGVTTLRPWDMEADEEGKPPLQPFRSTEELISNTIQCFERLDPYFAWCLQTMNSMGHLDLESKKGKAPGGFNYPLYESGVPFIFMNAVGTHRDLVTMVHEGGHAIHSFLTAHYPLHFFKNFPSEVAELASMSMELISMRYWDIFYTNPEDLKRAQKEQLQGVLRMLPWVAAIDAFQHWIYTHPGHTREERKAQWGSIMKRFGSSIIDWSGYEDALYYLWQKQLHLYEVPFYYIEYGIAQLGAIALWKSFIEDEQKAIHHYKKALSLGYTCTIGDIYAAAGISFRFTPEYVRSLANTVKQYYDELNHLN